MSDFAQHAPGTFSWPELATTDQKAAVAFYTALFGWGTNELPLGPDGTYTMFQLRGVEIGAAYTMRPDELKMGLPPHWNSYVTVAKVEDAVAKAQSLGGTVLAPPFDVMDAGRMAILQDPTGAVFQVWQAKNSIGARILYEPGALCWTELTTSDPAKAEAFYVGLFGWTPKHAGAGSPMPYTEFTVGTDEMPSIGMMAKPPELPPEVPSYWMPYFEVTDVDGTAKTATGLGARVVFGPQDIPDAGRFVVLGDPQGAVFAVFTRKAG